ncbi:MAG: hypothetical protein RID07_10940 [Lacipirellulaceae bacterium]
MTSIYQEVLGSDFERLHPQIQKRFGFSSADGIASIGTGISFRATAGEPRAPPPGEPPWGTPGRTVAARARRCSRRRRGGSATGCQPARIDA